jgi:hypothetical protein
MLKPYEMPTEEDIKSILKTDDVSKVNSSRFPTEEIVRRDRNLKKAEIPLWEKQDNELEEDYLAFQKYLQLGLYRKIPDLVPLVSPSSKSVTVLSRLNRLSVQNSWKDRALAYDRHEIEAQQYQLDIMKQRAMVKSVETLNKLGNLNTDILDGKIAPESSNAVMALQEMRQSNTLEAATKLHTAIFGTKQEVKQDMSINLAQAILSMDPKTIDI